MAERLQKVYGEVEVTHHIDGTARPNRITFEDHRRFEIERILAKCRATSTKVVGAGIRYTVLVRGQQAYLFDEELPV